MRLHSKYGGYTPVISHPDHTLDTKESNHVLSHLTHLCLDRLSEAGWSAAGRDIADCIIGGDFPALCHYDPDVLDLSASDQYWIGQALAFWRKRGDLDLGLDREAAARAKFRAAEQSCRRVNAKFAHWKAGRFRFSPLTEHVLHRAQLKVQSVLEALGKDGDVPPLEQFRPRFGPGATTSTPKKLASPLMKIRSALACSENMLRCSTSASGFIPTVSEALSTMNLWGPEEETAIPVEIHRGKLSFVPKNAKIDRAICTEPVLNGMFQLGLGDMLAFALRQVAGIDIRDQSRNQRAACYGSINGGLATIDLSSASDTIAINLVEHLFPPDWFDLLLSLRTAEIEDEVDGVIQLQKVSSMGNGFTFPLETLIFWALSLSVVEVRSTYHHRSALVYGDDIVVPADCAPALADVLAELGFTVNEAKSFWTGRFRESCGKDYVLGVDVRPVYTDGPLSRLSVMTLHNYFARKKEWAFCKCLESILHPSLRLRGPDGYGDGHLVSDVWVSKPQHRKGWSGYTFETFRSSPKQLRRELVKRFATPIRIPAWRWKPGTGWEQHGTKRILEYKTQAEWHIRRLATYVAYTREGTAYEPNQPYRHSIADPDAPIFEPLRVPGDGKTERLKIYIFEPPRLH